MVETCGIDVPIFNQELTLLYIISGLCLHILLKESDLGIWHWSILISFEDRMVNIQHNSSAPNFRKSFHKT